jgi:hypothetical protein
LGLDLPEGIRDLSADPAPWSDGLPCNTWSQGRDSPPSGDRPRATRNMVTPNTVGYRLWRSPPAGSLDYQRINK